MAKYNRRSVLTAGAAFAGVSALGFPTVLRAQADKIKIGHLTPLTGFLGALGVRSQRLRAGGKSILLPESP